MTSMRRISRTLTYATRTLDKKIMAIPTSVQNILPCRSSIISMSMESLTRHDCFGLEKHEDIDILMKLGIPEATAKDECDESG